MAIIDEDLSKIDKIGYVQAKRPEQMPILLDLYHDGRHYRYELLTANLREAYRGKRGPDRVEHTHAVYHIVLYVGGNGLMSCGGRRYAVGQGKVVLTSPGMAHAFTPPGGEVCYHALTFALKSEGGRSLAVGFSELLAMYMGRDVRIPMISEPDTETFAILKDGIEDNVQRLQCQPVDWLAHENGMIRIFECLCQMGVVANQSDRLVARAKRMLDARFAEHGLTLAALAAELHTVPEHLCRMFRQEHGISPVRYRNQLRTQAARALLRNTHLPCKAIADRLGYSDLYTFSKAYRRAAGRAPSCERQG